MFLKQCFITIQWLVVQIQFLYFLSEISKHKYWIVLEFMFKLDLISEGNLLRKKCRVLFLCDHLQFDVDQLELENQLVSDCKMSCMDERIHTFQEILLFTNILMSSILKYFVSKEEILWKNIKRASTKFWPLMGGEWTTQFCK